jgi:hypothetical protein
VAPLPLPQVDLGFAQRRVPSFLRQSAKTRLWDEAEEYRYRLENPTIHPSQPVDPVVAQLPAVAPPPAAPAAAPAPLPAHTQQKPRVTVAKAVEAYLTDAQSRGLESSTLSKLETMFRKQMLAWTKVERLEYADTLRHALFAHLHRKLRLPGPGPCAPPPDNGS